MFHYITNDKLVDEHSALCTFHNSRSPFFLLYRSCRCWRCCHLHIFCTLPRRDLLCMARKKRGHWTTCWQTVICSQNYGMLFHFLSSRFILFSKLFHFQSKVIHCLERMQCSINQTLSKNFWHNNHFSIKASKFQWNFVDENRALRRRYLLN